MKMNLNSNFNRSIETRLRSNTNRTLILKKLQIDYGKGRLTSSYNSTLPLHYPW